MKLMKNFLCLLVVLCTLQLAAQLRPPPAAPPAASATASVSSSNKESKDRKMSSPVSRLIAGRAKLVHKLSANNPSQTDPFEQFLDALERAAENYGNENYFEAKSNLLKALSLADLSDMEVSLVMVEALLDLGAVLDDDELQGAARKVINWYRDNNPQDAYAFTFEVAYVAYEVGEDEAAFDFFRECVDAGFNTAESAYMAASTAALLEQGAVALDWLEYALEAGFLKVLYEGGESSDYISTDEDLSSICNFQGYQNLRNYYGF